MSFAAPFWIIIGALVCCCLYLLLWKMERDRKKKLVQFAAPHLLGKFTANISQPKRLAKKLFYVGAVFCCFLALARPQYSFKWVDVKRQGIDIMFALDTSKSMLTEDVKPNRLSRAKFAILDFVQKLEGDRIGLLPFAGSTFLLCPLTVDYDAFSQSLSAVNTSIIPQGGTNLEQTINAAESILSKSANHKILILLSDGENLDGDLTKAVQEASEKGLKIFTVGVGTAGGELIPISKDGKTGFIKDEKGNFVTSKLDEKALKQIAEMSGGIYVPLGTDGEGLEAIYQQKLSIIPKEELAERKHKVPIERFEYPLGVALILLLIEYLLNSKSASTTRYFDKIKTAGRRIRKTKLLALVFLTLLPLQNFEANASEGEEAFAAGDYLGASMFYKESLEKNGNNPKLHYNHGTAAYKNNLFDQAIDSFDEALKSDDLALQELAYYNKGNSHYQKGKLSMQADPQLTAEEWQKSLKAFDGALALNPDMEDAKFNLDLVKKKLELLEQQQEQQKQEQGDQNQNDSEQKDDQQQGDDGQDQQENDGQNQQSSDPQEPGDENEQNPSEDQPGEEEQQESEDEKSGDEQNENPTPINEDETDKNQQAQENQVQESKEAGKMSEEEARQLLNSLKDEEGNLNFIPQQSRQDSQPTKDW